MAGSPKGGFPARRPGKLFGKKQMVMFGCIVLVLFVAPSLFGIGDTTDAHRIDPDDRGLVRTDFDGDRHRRRRRCHSLLYSTEVFQILRFVINF